MHIDSIENLLAHVKAAGQIALAAQRELRFDQRIFKDDGSVLTETDQKVEDELSEHIARLYPQANILGEETAHTYHPDRPYTFVIDPIDGTDVYSQGMPGWCISVALLDEALEPIAGIIYAPRWELLLLADIDKPATANGRALHPSHSAEPPSPKSNVMAYSRIHTQINWSRYPGKIRSIGSAALHLCFPLVYPGVYGAVEGRGGHIWDIAGAHAIVRSHGFALAYLGGGQIDYAVMLDGSPTGDNVLSGTVERIEVLRRILQKI